MLGRTYDDEICSIARALEVVGERWTLLILRDAFRGAKRFDDFEGGLGIARNVLSARLQRLCEEGVLERRLYQERPKRYHYCLTEKGKALWPVAVGLLKWGDEYYAPEGPPRIIEHAECGGDIGADLTCSRCGEPIGPDEFRERRGPGAPRRRRAPVAP